MYFWRVNYIVALSCCYNSKTALTIVLKLAQVSYLLPIVTNVGIFPGNVSQRAKSLAGDVESAAVVFVLIPLRVLLSI